MNLFLHYSAEPAPMGITDYGVGPNGTGYAYNSSSIRGIATIHSLSAKNASLPPFMVYNVSLQLNVFLGFRGGGTQYLFWVQDVAELNTSTNTVWFGNNLWNMSGGVIGTVLPSTVSGNGTIESGGPISVYVDYANRSLPGDFSNLTYPSNVGLEVLTTLSNGTPSLTFQYNDRGNWTTYDVVRFKFTQAAPSASFLIDGRQYLVISGSDAYEDAEFVLGGAAGGAATTVQTANLTMSLLFGNGHNWQRVPNSFDFGSDTGETVSNVRDALQTNPRAGNLSADVQSGVGGKLDSVYNRSFAALLNASVPFGDGEIEVNGTDLGPFTGSSFNLTLAPGTYSVEAVGLAGETATAVVLLRPGEYRSAFLSLPHSWNITFESQGLRSGQSWSVDLNGTPLSSRLANITFSEPNGTYPYLVEPIGGYRAVPRMGTVPVNGQDLIVTITFVQVVYATQFDEQGLPTGTNWSVTLGSAVENSTGPQIVFDEPNGSYQYTIRGTSEFRADPSSGTVPVSGNSTSVAVTFTVVTYTLWFNVSPSSELPPLVGYHSTWAVLLSGPIAGSGSTSNSSAIPGSIGFQEPAGFNGTYSVHPPRGLLADPLTGSAGIPPAGGAFTVIVTFTLMPAPAVLFFNASPAHPTPGAEVRLSVVVEAGVAPLTYTYTGLPEGCVSANTSDLNCTPTVAGRSEVSVAVSDLFGRNQTATVAVTVEPVPNPVSPSKPGGSTFLNLPAWVGYAVLVAGVALLGVGAIAAILLHRRRTATQRPTNPDGPPPH